VLVLNTCYHGRTTEPARRFQIMRAAVEKVRSPLSISLRRCADLKHAQSVYVYAEGPADQTCFHIVVVGLGVEPGHLTIGLDDAYIRRATALDRSRCPPWHEGLARWVNGTEGDEPKAAFLDPGWRPVTDQRLSLSS